MKNFVMSYEKKMLNSMVAFSYHSEAVENKMVSFQSIQDNFKILEYV